MTTTKALWDMDVRVRERNLKAGLIAADEVHKFLAALPDLAEQAQGTDVVQPAVGSGNEGAAPEADDEGEPQSG